MNTMRIATPIGYSSRPPRRMWPVVLVVALLLGLGGGAFAVAWFGRDEAAPPADAESTPTVTPLVDAAAGEAPGSATPANAAGSAAGSAGTSAAAGSAETPATTGSPDAAPPAGSGSAAPPADAPALAVVVI